jgi:WD40 repeat protein
MGEIHDVYSDGESIVSAGEDGRVKLWRLDGSSLRCVWTSSVIHSPLEDRPDVVKLRQAQKPDPVVLARCEGDIVAGVTEDGDLRIWRGTNFLETRIDVGGIHHGGVKRLELAGEDVLIHHSRSPTFTRYGNSVTTFVTADGLPLTALKAFLKPAALVAPTPEAHSCGRVIVAGDEGGQLHMWSWDGGSDPIRSWQAVSGKVTSLDFSCGLVAVGRYADVRPC